jgi:hypothetical protein
MAEQYGEQKQCARDIETEDIQKENEQDCRHEDRKHIEQMFLARKCLTHAKDLLGAGLPYVKPRDDYGDAR